MARDHQNSSLRFKFVLFTEEVVEEEEGGGRWRKAVVDAFWFCWISCWIEERGMKGMGARGSVRRNAVVKTTKEKERRGPTFLRQFEGNLGDTDNHFHLVVCEFCPKRERGKKGGEGNEETNTQRTPKDLTGWKTRVSSS